jgi:hypothetical protein
LQHLQKVQPNELDESLAMYLDKTGLFPKRQPLVSNPWRPPRQAGRLGEVDPDEEGIVMTDRDASVGEASPRKHNAVLFALTGGGSASLVGGVLAALGIHPQFGAPAAFLGFFLGAAAALFGRYRGMTLPVAPVLGIILGFTIVPHLPHLFMIALSLVMEYDGP